jgi:hypothetical protein
MIETREVTIYEIIGVKVGSTIDTKSRMAKQGYPDYRVVQVIEPNTLTVRECWEQEQDWAIRLGYEPENENNWVLFEMTRLGMTGQYSKERWQDTEYREKMKTVLHPFQQQGKQSINFKGTIVNSNGERFEGNAQLKEAGYHPGHISDCINGKGKTHKGLSWWREPL